MNVRKPVDYGAMYRELAAILAQNLPQMDEIYAIGKVIHQRPEKGAAVAAAEFLQANFPDRTGFSPRNVRRMRDFYRTYENDQRLLRLAMKIGWTLNVVIMEAELTSEARKWYLEQARERQWSKKELLNILSSGYEPDAEAEQKIDQENSSLRFPENCGIINQEIKEPPLCSLAITSSKAKQAQNFLPLFGKQLPLILSRQHKSIGKPTGARILFRMLRSKNMRWNWMRPESWSDLPLTGICRRACWFMWSIWRVRPAEIRRCPSLENTLGSVQHCWRSEFSFPSITATAVQFI
ncbi:MAG: hypothetical protein J6J02_02965 [Oscillospiraceae bacterium]|nr:hypothetical protein [Oscillospiraceae bacterium]